MFDCKNAATKTKILPKAGKINSVVLFSRKKNRKKQRIENLIFSAFGKILVLANAFFYSNSN